MHAGSYSKYEDMKLMQTLKKSTIYLKAISGSNRKALHAKQTNKKSLQRLMAEGLKLVSVLLTELLGSLSCLQRVRLARYGSLNHLLRTNNNNSRQP